MITDQELARRLNMLESESAIRRLMAEYLETRDVAHDGVRNADLFTPDGIWEAVGPLAAVLGRHEGREAIERRTVASAQQAPFSAHFLTNEAIAVDGDTAEGKWAFLQAAEVKGRAIWIAGRYHVDFVRIAGEWKIKHLRLENLFATPYEDGWAKTRFAT